MKYLKKLLRSKPFIIAVAAILIYTLAGFLLTPFLVRHYLPRVVQERFKKHAAIGEVRFNPYVFTFEADDFRISEPDGRPIVGFNRFLIDFELKSLFAWAWTFRLVSLEGLGVDAVIQKDGRLNLASLAPPSETTPPEKKDGQPPRLIFEDILIKEGRIGFTDRRQAKPAGVTIKPLTLHVKHLTTLPGQEGTKTITATTADGESFKWTGKVTLNPLAAKGSLLIDSLRVSTLSQFARDALNLEKPEGKLGITADYEIDMAGDEARVLVANLTVALTGIGLKLQGEENGFLELPEARLRGGRLDLSGRLVEVGGIAVNGGSAHLSVSEDGTLNVQRLAKTSGTKESSAAEPAVQGKETKPWRITLNGLDINGFGLDYKDLSRVPGLRAGVDRVKVGFKAEAEAGSQTRVLVNDITVGVSGLQAGFLDTTEPAIRVDEVALDGGNYDLAGNRFNAETVSIKGGSADVQRQDNGSLNLTVLFVPPEKGAVAKKYEEAASKGQPFGFLVKTVSLSGLQVAFSDLMVRKGMPVLGLEDVSATLSNVDGMSPMKFDMGVKVREGGRIEIAGTVDPSAASVESEVQVAQLDLLPFQPYIGKAAAVILKSGMFSTRGTLRHGIEAAGAKTLYQGGFNVEKLRVTEADGGETLVGWNSVKSEQLKLQLGPDSVEIGEIRVSQPVGKVIIEKDHTLNLARVIKSDAEPTREERRPTASTAGAFPYNVRRVIIAEGRVDFADLSLPMPFGTKIHELKGSVAGISSAKNARAQVKLDGHVDDYGTAKVVGELNTSDPKAFTDISVVFRNVEMSRLTPYSGKFAGRKIDSGKLSADLKYKIENGQVAGDNKLVVERLTLGEKFESPDAVNLPLDLAVALLEDSNGVIELGLPVHGNLDSPEFSFGALIWKALENVLTKIVTSPFRALAALIPGGGEETLKSVAFEPGSAEVSPPEKEKLVKLAGALQKRPQLKLSAQGRYNPETDGAALRTARINRTLAMRLGQKMGPETDTGLVDYSSPETVKVLEGMFRERFGADALKALKAELKAARDMARKESEKGKAVTKDGDAEDPGHLAKLLFTRLVEGEPVDEAALARLADARAQAVIAELSGQQAISAERLSAKPSASLEKDDPVTAELSVEMMK